MDKRENVVNNEIIKPTIIIRAATPEEERERLQFTIDRLDFYKSHGYSITLPDSVEEEVKKSENYYDKILFIGDDHHETYENAVKIQEISRNRILQSFDKFNEFSRYWDFKMFPVYPIILTKYGIGGSFDPDSGKIILKISRLFMPNIDPALNPIHEIVHIGVDHFVKEFNLNHKEKEGIVDGLCLSTLQETLPNYAVQNIGDKNIFKYVASENAWKNIPQVLEEYVKQYPR